MKFKKLIDLQIFAGGHELRERYSALVDKKFRKSLKTAYCFNGRYEGSPKAGAVNLVVRDTEVATGDYDKKTGGELGTSSTTYLKILVDKDKYVNELIDGYEAAAVPDGIVADRLDSAGYSMALALDSDGVTCLETEGTALENTTALTKSTVYDSFVDTRTKLSDTGVPEEGRFALVTPHTYGLILKSPEFIKASALGDAVVQTGALGKIAGFLIYETNNLSSTTEYVAGHRDWCHRVEEWSVPVAINDLKDGKHIGASAVQGRKVYAHKVSKKEAVLVKKNAATQNTSDQGGAEGNA